MSLFWQREKQHIGRRRSLEGVPVLNLGVGVENADSGKTFLRLASPCRAGWLDRFRPRVDARRFELDEFGAFVVQLIDGQRNVMDIIDRFECNFGMSRRESELGVVAFIKMLMKRRLLSVGLKSGTVEQDD